MRRWLALDAQVRRKRLRLLLKVVQTVCLVATPVGLLRGPLTVLPAVVEFITATLALRALERGASTGRVTTATLGVGLAVAMATGLAEGHDGVIGVAWCTVVPLIALSSGGPRAGLAVLGLSLVVSVVSLVLPLPGEPTAAHSVESWLGVVFSLLGACSMLFALAYSYDRHTTRTIAFLDRRRAALERARAEAEQAERAKSDFLATLSHEIRTPLAAATGMARMLEGETNVRRVRDGVKLLQHSADLLLSMLTDVLDLSLVEAAQVSLERVPVDVVREARTVVELLQPRAAEQLTSLELVVPQPLPEWVRLDAARWRQVVLNLVSNAVKFTRRGEVRCVLREVGGQLVLEVRDTGIGMSADALERLFQPFTQAETSTTREYGGTGLGLFITRRLVLALGGELTVESTPGKGTCFTARLPLEACDAPKTPLDGRDTTAREVLLVEDNPVNQLVASRLLERLGHRVTLAADGLEALERVRARRFDLVLMDCHMPRMDGYEAARTLRAEGFTMPVVALTAAVTVEDVARCHAAGMSEVLSKPLRPERLLEVLAALPVQSARGAA